MTLASAQPSNETLYYQLFNHAVFAAALSTIPEGVLLNVNEAWERMFGYSRQEAIGKTTLQLGINPDAEFRERFIAELQSTGRVRDAEMFLVAKGGGVHIYSVNIDLMSWNGQQYGLSTIQDITQRRRAEDDLAQSRRLLKDFFDNAEKLRQEEHKRFARELHDELGQILTGLRMDVAYLSMRYGNLGDEFHSKTDAMVELLDRAGNCVHDIVANLRPAVLDMGIVAALKWLCFEDTKHSGITFTLEVADDFIPISEVYSDPLFRIAQELLTNAIRHAQAKHVHVALTQEGEQIILAVRDDGIGFDPDASRKKSFGLLGIRERLQMLHGIVRIDSARSKGTHITILIPVQQSA